MKTLLLLLLAGNVFALGDVLPLKSAKESRENAQTYVKQKDVRDYRKFKNLCIVTIDDAVAHGRLSDAVDMGGYSDLAIDRVMRDLQDVGYIVEKSQGRRGSWLWIYWDKDEYERMHKPL